MQVFAIKGTGAKDQKQTQRGEGDAFQVTIVQSESIHVCAYACLVIHTPHQRICVLGNFWRGNVFVFHAEDHLPRYLVLQDITARLRGFLHQLDHAK
jgi:hypothetical protein